MSCAGPVYVRVQSETSECMRSWSRSVGVFRRELHLDAMDTKPPIAMVAPPGPVSTTSAAALSKLSLKKTPAGIAVFMNKFPSALGPLLASTLRSAMRGRLDMLVSGAANILVIIYD